jgi:ferredoxin
MSVDIFYFSGTGNSLFVARQLRERIPGARLIPIAGLLPLKRHASDAEAVGLVFPVHALSVPIAVIRFVKMLEIDDAAYVFAVETRLGIVFNGFGYLAGLLAKKRKRLNARFIVNMPSNDVKDEHYRVPDREALARNERGVVQQVEGIAAAVGERKDHDEADRSYLVGHPHGRLGNLLLEKTVVSLLHLSQYLGGVNYFYHDPKCIGCGVCGRVCLSGKIVMAGDRPVWQKGRLCLMCYACINFCPKEAIQIRDIPGIKSFSNVVGRYPHPHAASGDIEKEKANWATGEA